MRWEVESKMFLQSTGQIVACRQGDLGVQQHEQAMGIGHGHLKEVRVHGLAPSPGFILQK